MLFRVLGPVELAADGRRVALASRRQQAILATLLANPGETFSTDRLVDAVWGATPPATAAGSLHSHISRLRGVLARSGCDPNVVATDADGYRVELQGHDLDAARFEELARAAATDVTTDPRRAVQQFDDALALWRGPAFGELATSDAIRATATRLEQLRHAAIAGRIDAMLAVGAHAEVVGELEALVVQDPLAERHHAQLMLALHRDGRRAAALAAYRALHRRLRDEVGVEPGAALRDLHERLLREDPELVTAASKRASHPPPTAPPVAGAHPAPTDPGRDLFGRDGDIVAIAALVTDRPLVTLTGPGGVGKSRLATEVVDVVRGRFADGVAVGLLAQLRDPSDLPAALLGALGIPEVGERSTEDTLLGALADQHRLLVLDNCEHLLSSIAALVDRLRRTCPKLHVLATSREHLHLPDEHVWEVAPLTVPRAGAAASEVAATSAGALFVARARAVEPSFELTDGNAATIAQLCRRLDGIPLAIELAAARTRALAPEALADRLDHRFSLLTGGPHREAGRHRTLEATVDWSVGLLTDAEARLFDRLSIFAGVFALGAAEGVCSGPPLDDHDVAGVLAELVDKSLVTVDRTSDERRYRLLETLRTYARRRFDASDDAASLRRRHAAYHVELVEQLAPRIGGPDERRALADLDAAIDDLRVAYAWLGETQETDGAVRLSAALHDYLMFRPRAEMLDRAEVVVEPPDAAEHPAFAGAMATAARAALHRGQIDLARGRAEAALAAAERPSLPQLWAAYVLTTAALYEGRLDDALAFAEQRITIADAIDSPFHRALANVSRGLAYRYRDETELAVQAATDAQRDADRSGSPTARAWALYCLGEAGSDADPSGSAELLERAVDAARQVDRHLIEGVALVSLASLRGREEDPRRALEPFREAIAHWRRIGDYTHQLTTLRNLVELLVRIGADGAAATMYGAVTAGRTPSFGAEADRLAAAWERLEGRLGTKRAQAAAGRGRDLTSAEAVTFALGELDAQLSARGTAGRRAAPGAT